MEDKKYTYLIVEWNGCVGPNGDEIVIQIPDGLSGDVKDEKFLGFIAGFMYMYGSEYTQHGVGPNYYFDDVSDGVDLTFTYVFDKHMWFDMYDVEIYEEHPFTYITDSLEDYIFTCESPEDFEAGFMIGANMKIPGHEDDGLQNQPYRVPAKLVWNRYKPKGGK